MWVFVFLSVHVIHGKSDELRNCSTWEGKCNVCLKKIQWLQGIFCGKFWWSVNNSPPCKNAWCEDCYTSPKHPNFPIMNQMLREKLMEESDRLVSSWDPLLQDESEYLTARNGDHLMAPFECDFCIFSKLKHRSPLEHNTQDTLLLAMIRRANLDLFWSSAEKTVNDNTRRMKRAQNFSRQMGLKGPYRQEGPFPPRDYCGYQAAYQILMNSLNKGIINPKYTQWNTIRHLRASYGNQIR